MSPADVYQLDAVTFDAFVRFQNAAVADMQRAARQAKKGR